MCRSFYSLPPSPLIRDETSDRVGFFWCSSRTCSRMHMGSSRATMGTARSSLRFGGATSSRIWSLVRGSIMNSNNLPLVQGCLRARRTDGNLLLVPLASRGIEKNNTASVHAGFLISYNSVRAAVIHTVRDQLLAFPEYTVVVTGTYVYELCCPRYICMLGLASFWPCDMHVSADVGDRVKDIQWAARWRPSLHSLSSRTCRLRSSVCSPMVRCVSVT